MKQVLSLLILVVVLILVIRYYNLTRIETFANDDPAATMRIDQHYATNPPTPTQVETIVSHVMPTDPIESDITLKNSNQLRFGVTRDDPNKSKTQNYAFISNANDENPSLRLRLSEKDGKHNSFQIWGKPCTNGNCNGEGKPIYQFFDDGGVKFINPSTGGTGLNYKTGYLSVSHLNTNNLYSNNLLLKGGDPSEVHQIHKAKSGNTNITAIQLGNNDALSRNKLVVYGKNAQKPLLELDANGKMKLHGDLEVTGRIIGSRIRWYR